MTLKCDSNCSRAVTLNNASD